MQLLRIAAAGFPSLRGYAYLDKKGDFDGPSRLYAIGSRLYADQAFTDDIWRGKEPTQ